MFRVGLLNGAERNVPLSEAKSNATELYTECYGRGLWWRLGRRLLGQSPWLSSLYGEKGPREKANYHYTGFKSVPIARIRGSEKQTREFDGAFYPLNNNQNSRTCWIDDATQLTMGRNLPCVKLIQVKDAFYVRAGLHRISVAKEFGQLAVDAEVTVINSKTR